MKSSVVEVRPGAVDDIVLVARLHRMQFPEHLLGCLPEHLLASFYRQLVVGSIFRIAELDGAFAGFVLGGEQSVLRRSRREFVRANRVGLAGAVVRYPRLWPHIWARVLSRLPVGGGVSGFASEVPTRLLSIAVADEAKGSGVAAALIRSFETGLQARERYGLSVRDNNRRAIGFYLKSGFVEEGRRAGSVFYVKIAGDRGEP